MRRVHPNSCGYIGYTCDGLPELTDDAMMHEFTCDNVRERTSPAKEFDNYLNIPENIAGFSMQVEPILDMYAEDLPVAETDCLSLDVNEDDGYLDLYNLSDYKQKVVASSDGESYVLLSTYLPCFADKDSMLYPALLEPMLNVSLDPVDIDVLPTSDLAHDGSTIALVHLTKWRLIIERYMIDIIDWINWCMAKALRDLIQLINTNTQCKEFQIKLTSGKAMEWPGHRNGSAPKYSISGGTAYINGRPVSVSGLSGLTAPFDAYFVVKFENSGEAGYADPTVHIATSIGETDYAVGLGSVRLVKVKRAGKTYKLWQIVQEQCGLSADLLRFATPFDPPDGGVIFLRPLRVGGGRGAFEITPLGLAECDTQDAGGGDDDDETEE